MIRLRVLMLMLAIPVLAAAVAAQPALPLDLTAEVIGGQAPVEPRIPLDAPEVTTYPLTGVERELLNEIPGQPPRQVDPPPQALAWWRLPFYAVLGLPRDMVDAVAGGLSFVPVLNMVVMAGYEVVPVQWVMRHHRDWHRWPGRRNDNGHGIIDSEGWGFFPSARHWRMTYPSQRAARRNQKHNEELVARLREANRGIDEHNRELAARRLEARSAAVAAIRDARPDDPLGSVAGREASRRMIPYYLSQRLDEGAFALLVSSLALYLEAPRWVDELLWSELEGAQPAMLETARQLLEDVAEIYPINPRISRTLILATVLGGDSEQALTLARKHPDETDGRPARHRLVFETALAAGDPASAREALAQLTEYGQFANEQPLMAARLALAEDRITDAREELARLAQGEPGNPYLNYYLGVADLTLAARGEEFPASLRRAIERLERAVLLAPGPALKRRAEPALEWARTADAELARQPELGTDAAR